MPSFEVTFDVYCECGEALCNQANVQDSTYGKTRSVTIGPCPMCLETSRDEGYAEGEAAAEEKYADA